MKISRENIDYLERQAVITIGMFDGVHLGHCSLLNRVVERAVNEKGESVVITFDPHPRIVLSDGDISLKFLTSLEEKIYLLEKSGVDHLLVLKFTEAMSRMSTSDFVREILVKRLSLKHLIVGHDHHFGHRGANTDLTITECAKKFDFVITRIEALMEDGEKISSTRIRDYLKEGNLERANTLLGYEYILQGRVVPGKKIGRDMGYPTANIEPGYNFKLIPGDGVYAVEVYFEKRVFKSMLYIGTRPTLEKGGKRIIEANLFGFDGDMYGRELSIIFKHRIRGDMKFSTRELLQEQIVKDKEIALRLLV